MFAGGSPLEELAEMGAEEPFFREYYFHQLHGLLRSRPTLELAYTLPTSADDVNELARVVRDRFAYIGRFPRRRRELPHDRRQVRLAARSRRGVYVLDNQQDSQRLQPDRRERFGETFRSSYELLSAIGVDFA